MTTWNYFKGTVVVISSEFLLKGGMFDLQQYFLKLHFINNVEDIFFFTLKSVKFSRYLPLKKTSGLIYYVNPCTSLYHTRIGHLILLCLIKFILENKPWHFRLKTNSGKNIFCFRGIPYALPPVGQLRYKSYLNGKTELRDELN